MDKKINKSKTILIINKKNLKEHDYRGWIEEYIDSPELILFNADDQLDETQRMRYDEIEVFNNWKSNRKIDYRIKEIGRNKRIQAIIALSECDIVRADNLRRYLQISNVTKDGMDAYRDKSMMKNILKAQGIPMPEFKVIKSVEDILSFSMKYGYPLVVKPLDMAGAVGISIINNSTELDEYIYSIIQIRDEPCTFMVEQANSGSMIIVDGLMKDGSILYSTVSSYLGNCLDCAKKLQPLGVVQEDYDNKLWNDSQQMAKKIIHAMPHVPYISSFHLELFYTKGKLMFCEIAARTGGGRINEIFEYKTGINLEKCNVLGQCGVNQIDLKEIDNQYAYGFALLPMQEGVIVSIPNECEVDGVLSYKKNAEKGMKTAENKKASDCIAYVVFRGKNKDELTNIYNNILNWYNNNFLWERV